MKLTVKHGYGELCLSNKFDLRKLDVIRKLGYKTVALNHVVDGTAFMPKKKGKKGELRESPDIIPAPLDVFKDVNKDMKILHRLTVEISDPSSCIKLFHSENIKKYDLLAVMPTTTSAFNHACTSMDIDIISFAPDSATNMKLNRKLYRQAIDRGVFFEIMYAPALIDSVCRKNIIHKAHLYHTIGKSANILLTSGALNEFQVRGPHDIINLGLILGLNEQQCKNAMTENVRKVLLKADSRKRGKAAVFVCQKLETSMDLDITNAPSESKIMKMSN